MNAQVIAKGLSHLVIKRCIGPFRYRRKWLERTQWMTAEELAAIQFDLLGRLVRHCYRNVSYYRREMDRLGLSPHDIQTLEDIRRFPILTKQRVLEAGDSITCSRMFTRRARTGGTTGTPMKLRRNLFSIGNEHAFVRRQWDWAGIGFSDRCAVLIAGRRIAEHDSPTERLYAYDPFMKELTLSTFHLSPATVPAYVEAMRDYNVKALFGISSAVYLMARNCLDRDIQLRLKAVLTTSETMTDHMRKTISEAFGCAVYDFYGAAERVCYIHTCEHGSYHIVPEYGLTELLPVDGEPGVCKIVATGFWNMAMPLVRYDTGDLVVASDAKCPCGRAFDVIDSISGRETDSIKTPSGVEHGPTVIARVLKTADNILASQIVQDAPDRINVLYVPGDKFGPADLEKFKKKLAYYLSAELTIDLTPVAEIPKTESGKTKLIVSSV